MKLAPIPKSVNSRSSPMYILGLFGLLSLLFFSASTLLLAPGALALRSTRNPMQLPTIRNPMLLLKERQECPFSLDDDAWDSLIFSLNQTVIDDKIYVEGDMVTLQPDGVITTLPIPQRTLLTGYETRPLLLHHHELDPTNEENLRGKIVRYFESIDRGALQHYALLLLRGIMDNLPEILAYYKLQFLFAELQQTNRLHQVPLFKDKRNFREVADRLFCDANTPIQTSLNKIIKISAVKQIYDAFMQNPDKKTAFMTGVKQDAKKYFLTLLGENSTEIFETLWSTNLLFELSITSYDKQSKLVLDVLKKSFADAVTNPDKLIQKLRETAGYQYTPSERSLLLRKNFNDLLKDLAAESDGEALVTLFFSNFKPFNSQIIVVDDLDLQRVFERNPYLVSSQGGFTAVTQLAMFSGLSGEGLPYLRSGIPQSNRGKTQYGTSLDTFLSDELTHAAVVATYGATIGLPPYNEKNKTKYLTALYADESVVEKLMQNPSDCEQYLLPALRNHMAAQPKEKRLMEDIFDNKSETLFHLRKNVGKSLVIPYEKEGEIPLKILKIAKDPLCGGRTDVVVMYELPAKQGDWDYNSLLQSVLDDANRVLSKHYPPDERPAEVLNQLRRLSVRYGWEVTRLLFPQITDYYWRVFIPHVREKTREHYFASLGNSAPFPSQPSYVPA